LLAHVAGDRHPPRGLERRITIGCHASLSGIDYLSIDRFTVRSLSSHVNLYLSIERATDVGSFCGMVAISRDLLVAPAGIIKTNDRRSLA
jgi:hypothetical protein